MVLWVLGPAAPGLSLPCRITDMSKASMSSRPEPGYENMDHFSINVDYVAEMLRTIEFQTGACPGKSLLSPGALGLPGVPSPQTEPLSPPALCGDPTQYWGCGPHLWHQPGALQGQSCPRLSLVPTLGWSHSSWEHPGVSCWVTSLLACPGASP